MSGWGVGPSSADVYSYYAHYCNLPKAQIINSSNQFC